MNAERSISRNPQSGFTEKVRRVGSEIRTDIDANLHGVAATIFVFGMSELAGYTKIRTRVVRNNGGDHKEHSAFHKPAPKLAETFVDKAKAMIRNGVTSIIPDRGVLSKSGPNELARMREENGNGNQGRRTRQRSRGKLIGSD